MHNSLSIFRRVAPLSTNYPMTAPSPAHLNLRLLDRILSLYAKICRKLIFVYWTSECKRSLLFVGAPCGCVLPGSARGVRGARAGRKGGTIGEMNARFTHARARMHASTRTHARTHKHSHTYLCICTHVCIYTPYAHITM